MHVARRALATTLVTALTCLVLVVSPAVAAGPSVWVAANGLNNPRGIAVGADGRVLVPGFLRDYAELRDGSYLDCPPP